MIRSTRGETDDTVMRICSLLPGASEVVVALGRADDLVGVSHTCDYPPELYHKPVLVHSTVDSQQATSDVIDRQVKERVMRGDSLYVLDEARFLKSQPSVVITQELCEVCATTPTHLARVIAALPRTPTVLSLNPTTLDDVLNDIERIGEAIGRKPEGQAYATRLRTRLRVVEDHAAAVTERPRVACLDWLDPFYVAGHWIPQMVRLAGGMDVLNCRDLPSHPITWEQLVHAAPEVLVLMPCGFSAGRSEREALQLADHSEWQQLPAVQQGRAYAVDASSFFSRPGPRLVEGVEILAALFHPALFGHPVTNAVRKVDVSLPAQR